MKRIDDKGGPPYALDRETWLKLVTASAIVVIAIVLLRSLLST